MGNKFPSNKHKVDSKHNKKRMQDEDERQRPRPVHDYGHYTSHAKLVGTEENIPDIECEQIDSTASFRLTNGESIDISLLRHHSKLIPPATNKALIELLEPLKKEALDYRYLVRDQILTCKMKGYGQWMCESCWHLNDPYSDNPPEDENSCQECGTAFDKKAYFCFESEWKLKWDKERREEKWSEEEKQRERAREKEEFERKMNLYNFIDDEMSKQQLIAYHNELFKKWKIRIQDLIDPALTATDRYWIPAEFRISNETKKVQFVSDIPGLPKQRYSYGVFEDILSAMLPSFGWVLGKDLTEMTLNDGCNFKVIINVQQYQLMPGQKYHGGWHREGFFEEQIIAAGVYYYDRSDWFDDEDETNDLFGIETTAHAMGCHVKVKQYEKQIKIRNGDVVVFNNDSLNHRLSVLENKDTEKVLTRSLLCFFLVRPDERQSADDGDGGAQKKRLFYVDGEEQEISILSAAQKMVNKHWKFADVVDYWFRTEGTQLMVSYADYEMLTDIIVDFCVFSLSKERRLRDEWRKKRLTPSQTRGVSLRWVSVAN